MRQNFPINISEASYGWRVIIRRTDITYRAYVAFNGDRDAALRKAIALRDEFFAIHGQYGPSGQRPRSNTGIAGISEQTKWFHGQPYPCFEVVTGRRTRTRFTYQTLTGRDNALNRAKDWRTKQLSHA